MAEISLDCFSICVGRGYPLPRYFATSVSKSPISNGFARKSSAPASLAICRVSLWAERMMIGRWYVASWLLSCLQIVRPSVPESRISRNSRSGNGSCICCTACPSISISTAYPASSSISCSISPIPGSSSATSILLRMLLFSFLPQRLRQRARFWLWRAWDGKEKGRADAHTTFYPHPSPLPFDNLCRNKEAQPKTREGLVLRVAHTKEALKDLLVFLRGDANAKILHADGGGIRVSGKLHQDGMGLGRIFHGVGEQIGEHLTNALWVPIDGGTGRSLDANLVPFCGMAHLLDDVSHEGIQVKALVVPGEFARLYAGHVEQLTDQMDKFVQLRIHPGQHRRRAFITRFGKAGVQHLRIAFQTGDGRLEFVTGNRHKFLALLQQLLLFVLCSLAFSNVLYRQQDELGTLNALGIERHASVTNPGKSVVHLVIHESVIGGEQLLQQGAQGGNIPLAVSQLEDPATLRVRRLHLEKPVEGPVRALHTQLYIQDEQWLPDGLHNRVSEITRFLQLRIALQEFRVQDVQFFVAGLNLFFGRFQFFIEAL